ncbi:pentatricopeptide repeat-containing protein mitochondrial-like isoform X3 [Gossypium australe]|uniref:Pentatricopeptide repeat-containing protein mitochondrial-like isoform X3 n=1 Tax=Gossypium australe TaxID=47621 RepID=A0A5B6V9T2_9ROSI|nr:pentatricopeptide repeat-containing protein mitochondrial-like isoform X3 [Gossypium australe]
MANIYTSAGKRKEAAKTRSMTRNKGLPDRDQLLIHVFMAGDQSDHQSVDIYEKLNELNTKLKEAGYVAESHHGKNY